jgi:hypothetical protein
MVELHIFLKQNKSCNINMFLFFFFLFVLVKEKFYLIILPIHMDSLYIYHGLTDRKLVQTNLAFRTWIASKVIFTAMIYPNILSKSHPFLKPKDIR